MSAAQPKLRIAGRLWRALHQELELRGGRQRETGAFLIGERVNDITRIEDVVYYDDVDPQSRAFTHINLRGCAFGKVWEICRMRQMDVVADVHTHPFAAFQSPLDRANPMIDRQGHIALILSKYASAPDEHSSVGLYQYLGSRKWRALSTPSLPTQVLEVFSS